MRSPSEGFYLEFRPSCGFVYRKPHPLPPATRYKTCILVLMKGRVLVSDKYFRYLILDGCYP